jgi:hypothetical protein
MPHKSCYRKGARHDDASDGSRVRRRPATPLSAAQRREKAKILDEFCQTTGLHRKAAIRLLNETSHPKLVQRGRPRKYGPEVVEPLRQIWEVGDPHVWQAPEGGHA